jgi:putative lipoprotein
MRQPVIVIAVFLLSACQGGTPPVPQADAAPRVAWQCEGGLHFDAITHARHIRLVFAGESVILPREPAASGERYARGGDSFHRRENGAQLRLDGGPARHCRVDQAIRQARARGVDYRAIGQEPGWLLDISAEEAFRFEYAYGTEHVELPYVPPHRLEEGRIQYRVADGQEELMIHIHPENCRDAMSGFAYPDIVTVQYRGHTYRGCGRPL